ncbi:metallophosphoesterase family protein [Lacunimicrobium album]
MSKTPAWMSRRNFLSLTAMTVAGSTITSSSPFKASDRLSPATTKPSGALRILHLTDIHIRPEEQAAQRCERLLTEAIRQAGDFELVLNGGDSVYAVDYDNITRERVLEQWELWDRCVVKPLGGKRMLSALGNHDMWWAAPSKTHDMYGKQYALDRLGQNNRYLSTVESGWLILVLDGNNSGLLDEEQLTWFHQQLREHAELPVLVMSHQPILFAQHLFQTGMSKRKHQIIDPVVNWKLQARPVYFISGHEHMLDQVSYANVTFLCNGAFSGAWWEYSLQKKDMYEGNNSVAGTPMGYAIIDLNSDGTLNNQYIETTDCRDGQLLPV